MYKDDLALNNLQLLIYNKTKQNQKNFFQRYYGKGGTIYLKIPKNFPTEIGEYVLIDRFK